MKSVELFMGFNFGFRSKTQIGPDQTQIGAPTRPLHCSPPVRAFAPKDDAWSSAWRPCQRRAPTALPRVLASSRVWQDRAVPEHVHFSARPLCHLPWLRLAPSRANAAAVAITGRAELHGRHLTSHSVPFFCSTVGDTVAASSCLAPRAHSPEPSPP
jgi:hypothetical protein